MADHSKNVIDIDSGALSLMRELQVLLYRVARTAELGDKDSMAQIEKDANIAMKLIDSYLLAAQTEYGQARLDLTTVGIGSLLHDSAYEVRQFSGVDVLFDVKVSQPVFSHRLLLKNMLFSLGYFISGCDIRELKFCTFKSKKGEVGVAVLAENFDLTNGDLKKALSVGNSQMIAPKHTVQSGVMLIVANLIANAFGSELKVKKISGYKGLSFSLAESRQLSIV